MAETRKYRAGGREFELPADMPPEQAKALIAQRLEGSTPVAPPSQDNTTGAPAGVRAVVGPEYRNESDRLATLQQFYPDARALGNGNFVFTENGRQRLYNPRGLDIGDLAENARIAAEMIGGAAGGIAAIPNPPMIPVAVGLGAAAAGQLYDAGMAMGGQVDTRGAGQRTVDAAIDFGANAVGQQLGAETIPRAFQQARAGVRNRLTRTAPAEILDDFRAAGVPIEGAAGAISSSRGMQGVEQALGKLPTSAGVMERAQRSTMQGVEDEFARVVRSYGQPLSPQEAGDRLITGAKAAGDRFNATRQKLDDQAMSMIGANRPVTLTAVDDLLQQWEAKYAQNPNAYKYLEKPIKEARGLVEDTTGGLSFRAARDARTALGQALQEPSAATGFVGKGKGELRSLYGALREDLMAAAEEAGPDALRAMRTHDRYVRMQSNLNLPMLDKIAEKDADTAFRFAFQRSKDGAARINQIRRNYKPEEWRDITATILDRMGKATPGRQGVEGNDFSVATFLTNWSKMSPEAKNLMFASGKNKELATALDRLVRITGSLKSTSEMANFSGTAQQNVYMQLLQGGIGASVGANMGNAIAGAAVATVTPFAAAKLMTNPRFVQWFGKAATIKPTNYNALSAHALRLWAVAEAEPEIKEEVRDFISAFRRAQ